MPETDPTKDATKEKEKKELAEAVNYRIQRALEGSGWQLRFEKVHDCLKVFASNGALITFPERGQGGKFTWHSSDPVGETHGIGLFVGDGDQIHLYSVITADGSSGDHQCDMDTLYNGARKQRWEFDNDEE